MIRFIIVLFFLTSHLHGIDYYYGTDKGAESELSDEDLTVKIREKLRLGWSEFWFNFITVEVNHGIATLQGKVPSWDDKTAVESLVKETDGVKKLKSLLRVESLLYKERRFADSAATNEDEQLNRKIRQQLGGNFKDVHLNTSNAQVKLEGSIANLRDQEKLVTEIRKIQGVASVTSYLIIKNLQERQTQN